MDATETPSLIEQAAGWLAALDAGTADPDAFARWRDADPRHAAAFAQVAATWDKLGAARSLAAPEPTFSTPRAPSPTPSRRHLLQAASVAAVALLGGGLGSRALARSSAETAIGERRTLVLDDGSRLDLNTDSAVEWRVRAGRRHVWLERGEIALDVAPGERGLLLAGGDAEALLSPGRFNARLTGGTLSVLVLAGMSGAVGASASVGPGARLLVSPGTARTVAAAESERERALAWRRGEIVFDGEPLVQAVEEYNRYLTRKLVVGDPALRSIELGGRFTSNDPADFLAALRASFGVVATARDDRVVLVSGGRN